MAYVRSLAIVGTVVLCVLSFSFTLKVAEFLGFDLSSLRNPDQALAGATIALVLVIHLVPIAIILSSQKFLFRQPLAKLGFLESPWRATLMGLWVGISLKLISTVGTFFLSPSATLDFPLGSVDFTSWLPFFAWFLLALNLNSLNEELIYRAFPLSKMTKNKPLHVFAVIVASALLFSVVHFLLESPDLGRFVYRMAFGILVGLIYVKFQSLWLIAGLHTGWNFVAMAASEYSWKEGGLITLSNLDSSMEISLNTLVLAAASVLGIRYFLRGQRSPTPKSKQGLCSPQRVLNSSTGTKPTAK